MYLLSKRDFFGESIWKCWQFQTAFLRMFLLCGNLKKVSWIQSSFSWGLFVFPHDSHSRSYITEFFIVSVISYMCSKIRYGISNFLGEFLCIFYSLNSGICWICVFFFIWNIHMHFTYHKELCCIFYWAIICPR